VAAEESNLDRFIAGFRSIALLPPKWLHDWSSAVGASA
jgi:hypothetical protein